MVTQLRRQPDLKHHSAQAQITQREEKPLLEPDRRTILFTFQPQYWNMVLSAQVFKKMDELGRFYSFYGK